MKLDAFELNKIAGAVLFALLVFFGARTLSHMVIYAPAPEQPGFDVAVVEEPVTAEEEAEEIPPLAVRLQQASVERGASQARQCVACHTFGQGEPHRIGPNLYDIYGRPIGEIEGYTFSPALAGMDGEWDYENMDAFIESPRSFAPGTKMAFAGTRDAARRADLLVYLREYSESPPPLPEAPAAPAEAPAPAQPDRDAAAVEEPAEAPTLAQFLAQASPERGRALIRQCAVCHTFGQGEPHRVGPNLYGIVGRPIGEVEGYSYSQALAGMDGVWDYETLDRFIQNPRGLAPGTKMAFAGVRDPAQRADILVHLREYSDSPPPLPDASEQPQP